MAANDRVVLATKNSDLELGGADDAIGTYSTGSLRGRVHAINIARSWMKVNNTAMGDENTRDFKTVQDLNGSFEWIVTEQNELLIETLYNQDSTKFFPIRWSPFGSATGKRFWQYAVDFGDFNEGAAAEGIIVINQSFKIQVVGPTGTHA